MAASVIVLPAPAGPSSAWNWCRPESSCLTAALLPDGQLVIVAFNVAADRGIRQLALVAARALEHAPDVVALELFHFGCREVAPWHACLLRDGNEFRRLHPLVELRDDFVGASFPERAQVGAGQERALIRNGLAFHHAVLREGHRVFGRRAVPAERRPAAHGSAPPA